MPADALRNCGETAAALDWIVKASHDPRWSYTRLSMEAEKGNDPDVSVWFPLDRPRDLAGSEPRDAGIERTTTDSRTDSRLPEVTTLDPARDQRVIEPVEE